MLEFCIYGFELVGELQLVVFKFQFLILQPGLLDVAFKRGDLGYAEHYGDKKKYSESDDNPQHRCSFFVHTLCDIYNNVQSYKSLPRKANFSILGFKLCVENQKFPL